MLRDVLVGSEIPLLQIVYMTRSCLDIVAQAPVSTRGRAELAQPCCIVHHHVLLMICNRGWIIAGMLTAYRQLRERSQDGWRLYEFVHLEVS